MSWCSWAIRISSSVRSPWRTGFTRVRCLPTGQYWNLAQPSFGALIDAPGIQIVVIKWPYWLSG